jgi:hypothetical protein
MTQTNAVTPYKRQWPGHLAVLCSKPQELHPRQPPARMRGNLLKGISNRVKVITRMAWYLRH